MGASRAPLLRSLASQIESIEAAGRRCARPPFPLGVAGLERFLPEGGLSAGSLVELLSEETGGGAYGLALFLARQVMDAGRRVLMVIDGLRDFYPPAAARLGVDLDRTYVIRPKPRDFASTVNQALRCRAVGAVIAVGEQLIPSPCRTHRSYATYVPHTGRDGYDSRTLRQMQLAAERGEGVGLLLRPAQMLRSPSFARLRLRITPAATPELPRSIRRMTVEVVRCRGGREGASFVLEMDDEALHVRVLSEVAAATARVGSA